MPTNINCNASSSELKNDVILSWKVHLAGKHPEKVVISAAAIALSSLAAYYIGGGLASIVVVLLMIASLSDFLFPVEYVISANGAACYMLFKKSEIRWENVKRCYIDKLGIKLSPLDGESRLEAFRGVYLRFNGNEEQVIEAVKSMRAKHV